MCVLALVTANNLHLNGYLQGFLYLSDCLVSAEVIVVIVSLDYQNNRKKILLKVNI